MEIPQTGYLATQQWTVTINGAEDSDFSFTGITFSGPTNSWSMYSNGTSWDYTQLMDVIVEGARAMSAKLAELTGREDHFLNATNVSISFAGASNVSVPLDFTPEESEEDALTTLSEVDVEGK